MKQFFLFLIFNLLLTHMSYGETYPKVSKLFIMLNVDNTILDRISPHDSDLMKRLSGNGYTIQKLEFAAIPSSSFKFMSMYRKLSKGEKVAGESEYMSRIQVEQTAEDRFHVLLPGSLSNLFLLR